MVNKKIIRRNKNQLKCGQASPGATLAFLKNMVPFCRDFNEKTKDRNGELVVNVKIVVYDDMTYSYTVGTTPTSLLIKKIIGERKDKIISDEELEKTARKIMSSLNTDDIEKAKKIVAGTVRSFNKT